MQKGAMTCSQIRVNRYFNSLQRPISENAQNSIDDGNETIIWLNFVILLIFCKSSYFIKFFSVKSNQQKKCVIITTLADIFILINQNNFNDSIIELINVGIFISFLSNVHYFLELA